MIFWCKVATFKHFPNLLVGLGSFSGLRVNIHIMAEIFDFSLSFSFS